MKASEDPQVHAMHHLTSALQLLDESDAPADIGARIAETIARLSEVLNQSRDADQKVSQ